MSYEIPDTTGVDFSDAPLPAGTYKVAANDYQVRTSFAGNEYLEITFKVLEGDQRGRSVKARFNFHHDNPKVVKISLEQMAALKNAAGIDQKNTSLDALMEKPLDVYVINRETDIGVFADIRRFYPAGEGSPVKAAGEDTPVWKR